MSEMWDRDKKSEKWLIIDIGTKFITTFHADSENTESLEVLPAMIYYLRNYFFT